MKGYKKVKKPIWSINTGDVLKFCGVKHQVTAFARIPFEEVQLDLMNLGTFRSFRCTISSDVQTMFTVYVEDKKSWV